LKVLAGELDHAVRSLKNVQDELQNKNEEAEGKERELEQLLWRLQRSQQALQVSQSSHRRQQETKHEGERQLRIGSAFHHLALLLHAHNKRTMQRRYQAWIHQARHIALHKTYSTPLEAAKLSMSQQSIEKASGRIFALWLSLEKMGLQRRLLEWRAHTIRTKVSAEKRESARKHQAALVDAKSHAKQHLQLKSALHIKLLLGKLRVGWVQLAYSFRSWCGSTRAQSECERRLATVKLLEIAQMQTNQLEEEASKLREDSRAYDLMCTAAPPRHLGLLLRGRWRAWSVAQMWRCLWRWQAIVNREIMLDDAVDVVPAVLEREDEASLVSPAVSASRVQDKWRTRRTSWLQAHVSELVAQVCSA
jgi:hypothetical protein